MARLSLIIEFLGLMKLGKNTLNHTIGMFLTITLGIKVEKKNQGFFAGIRRMQYISPFLRNVSSLEDLKMLSGS